MKKKYSITKLFEFVLREAKCPSCGSEGAYVGFSSIECANPSCKNFSQKQAAAADNKSADNKSGGYTSLRSKRDQSWYKSVEKRAERVCGKTWKEEIDKVYGQGAADTLLDDLYKKHYDEEHAGDEASFYYDLATGKLYGGDPANYPEKKIIPGKPIKGLPQAWDYNPKFDPDRDDWETEHRIDRPDRPD